MLDRRSTIVEIRPNSLMRKLTLYTAASLDGLIAGPTAIGWLDEIDGRDDYGFAAFLDTIGATLSGTATYQIAADFTDDPYLGKTNYVFTRTSPPPADTNVWHFVTGDIVAFTRGLKAQEGAGIWLVGGGQINTVMLKAGLIDEIIVTLIPIVLGDGIPLFAPGAPKTGFTTVSSQSYDTGLVQWTMARG
jgi:dihydrofolate reductase